MWEVSPQLEKQEVLPIVALRDETCKEITRTLETKLVSFLKAELLPDFVDFSIISSQTSACETETRRTWMEV